MHVYRWGLRWHRLTPMPCLPPFYLRALSAQELAFLAYAVLAKERALAPTGALQKGIYFLGGLTEGGETLLAFVLMCIFPSAFPVIAYVFSALCVLTTGTRIATGIKTFQPTLEDKT